MTTKITAKSTANQLIDIWVLEAEEQDKVQQGVENE